MANEKERGFEKKKKVIFAETAVTIYYLVMVARLPRIAVLLMECLLA